MLRSRWRLALAAVALPAAGLAAVIPVVCVPTFLAALVLERWTRRVAPVPVAIARSLRT